MTDPRDKQFHQLQRKGIENLNQDELALMLAYAMKMERWVSHSKSRRGWKDLADQVRQKQSIVAGDE